MSPFEIKNVLISLAEDKAQKSTSIFLNAGRGNPNWIAMGPREAFHLLGQWALSMCKYQFLEVPGVVAMPQRCGIDKAFEKFLSENENSEGGRLLAGAYRYAVDHLGADPEELVYEWAQAIIGDEYPTPPRILKYTEAMIQPYLAQEMGQVADDGGKNYDLFATEGGTAGMCYIFDTFVSNHLLKKGDKIALMSPIFTPYIEIPELDRLDFEVVNITANPVRPDGLHDWQYPPEELNKLRDKSIKLVCLVNPSNPPSYQMSKNDMDLLVDIVKNDNPNLMIVSDDVYGTFAEDFVSLMYKLPYNTVCVYSFSKYFGATGWRLAVIAVNNEKNAFDELLSRLTPAEKADLDKRYGSMTLDVSQLKFIDRLVADSRLVALNHTAGLSTPQQIQMSLFAAMCLLDTDQIFKHRMQEIVKHRLSDLWSTTGFTVVDDPMRVGYYSEIDLAVWAKKLYGDNFFNWLQANYNPLDVVMRLASETSIVLLNGGGFDAPQWSVRTSLANLDEPSYPVIGTAIRRILEQYADEYRSKH